MMHATKTKTGYCSRCRDDVRTVQPWAHWGRLRYAYFGVLGLALLCMPVILCDGFVLIPTLMVFMAAIGPLNSLAGKKPTCAQCGAVAGPLQASGPTISPLTHPPQPVAD